jgi:hypothetical protein
MSISDSEMAALEEVLEERGRDTRLEKRRVEDRWRIDKTISPAIIVTMVTFIVTGTLAYADLKRSDELLKVDNMNLHQLFQHMEANEELTLAKINEQYKDLNAKVDRLIERQIPRPGPK